MSLQPAQDIDLGKREISGRDFCFDRRGYHDGAGGGIAGDDGFGGGDGAPSGAVHPINVCSLGPMDPTTTTTTVDSTPVNVPTGSSYTISVAELPGPVEATTLPSAVSPETTPLPPTSSPEATLIPATPFPDTTPVPPTILPDTTLLPSTNLTDTAPLPSATSPDTTPAPSLETMPTAEPGTLTELSSISPDGYTPAYDPGVETVPLSLYSIVARSPVAAAPAPGPPKTSGPASPGPTIAPSGPGPAKRSWVPTSTWYPPEFTTLDYSLTTVYTSQSVHTENGKAITKYVPVTTVIPPGELVFRPIAVPKKVNKAPIVAGAFGGIFAVMLVLLIAFLVLRRRNRRRAAGVTTQSGLFAPAGKTRASYPSAHIAMSEVRGDPGYMGGMLSEKERTVPPHEADKMNPFHDRYRVHPPAH